MRAYEVYWWESSQAWTYSSCIQCSLCHFHGYFFLNPWSRRNCSDTSCSLMEPAGTVRAALELQGWSKVVPCVAYSANCVFILPGKIKHYRAICSLFLKHYGEWTMASVNGSPWGLWSFHTSSSSCCRAGSCDSFSLSPSLALEGMSSHNSRFLPQSSLKFFFLYFMNQLFWKSLKDLPFASIRLKFSQ